MVEKLHQEQEGRQPDRHQVVNIAQLHAIQSAFQVCSAPVQPTWVSWDFEVCLSPKGGKTMHWCQLCSLFRSSTQTMSTFKLSNINALMWIFFQTDIKISSDLGYAIAPIKRARRKKDEPLTVKTCRKQSIIPLNCSSYIYFHVFFPHLLWSSLNKQRNV